MPCFHFVSLFLPQVGQKQGVQTITDAHCWGQDGVAIPPSAHQKGRVPHLDRTAACSPLSIVKRFFSDPFSAWKLLHGRAKC